MLVEEGNRHHHCISNYVQVLASRCTNEKFGTGDEAKEKVMDQRWLIIFKKHDGITTCTHACICGEGRDEMLVAATDSRFGSCR